MDEIGVGESSQQLQWMREYMDQEEPIVVGGGDEAQKQDEERESGSSSSSSSSSSSEEERNNYKVLKKMGLFNNGVPQDEDRTSSSSSSSSSDSSSSTEEEIDETVTTTAGDQGPLGGFFPETLKGEKPQRVEEENKSFKIKPSSCNKDGDRKKKKKGKAKNQQYSSSSTSASDMSSSFSPSRAAFKLADLTKKSGRDITSGKYVTFGLVPTRWNSRSKRVQFMEQLYEEFFSLGEDLRDVDSALKGKTESIGRTLRDAFANNPDLIIIRPEAIGWVDERTRDNLRDLLEWIETYLQLAARTAIDDSIYRQGLVYTVRRLQSKILGVGTLETLKKGFSSQDVDLYESSSAKLFSELDPRVVGGEYTDDYQGGKLAEHKSYLSLDDLLIIEKHFINNLFFFDEDSLNDENSKKAPGDVDREQSVAETSRGIRSMVRRFGSRIVNAVNRRGRRVAMILPVKDNRIFANPPSGFSNQKQMNGYSSMKPLSQPVNVVVKSDRDLMAKSSNYGTLLEEGGQDQDRRASSTPQVIYGGLPDVIGGETSIEEEQEDEDFAGLGYYAPDYADWDEVDVTLETPVFPIAGEALALPANVIQQTSEVFVSSRGEFNASEANAMELMNIRAEDLANDEPVEDAAGLYVRLKYPSIEAVYVKDLLRYYNVSFFEQRQNILTKKDNGVFSSSRKVRQRYVDQFLSDDFGVQGRAQKLYRIDLAAILVSNNSALTTQEQNKMASQPLFDSLNFIRALVTTARARDSLLYRGQMNDEDWNNQQVAVAITHTIPIEKRKAFNIMLEGVLNKRDYHFFSVQKWTNTDYDREIFLTGGKSREELFALTRQQRDALVNWYMALDPIDVESGTETASDAKLSDAVFKRKSANWRKYVSTLTLEEHFLLSTALWRLWYMTYAFGVEYRASPVQQNIRSSLAYNDQQLSNVPKSSPDPSGFTPSPDPFLGYETENFVQVMLTGPISDVNIANFDQPLALESTIYAAIPSQFSSAKKGFRHFVAAAADKRKADQDRVEKKKLKETDADGDGDVTAILDDEDLYEQLVIVKRPSEDGDSAGDFYVINGELFSRSTLEDAGLIGEDGEPNIPVDWSSKEQFIRMYVNNLLRERSQTQDQNNGEIELDKITDEELAQIKEAKEMVEIDAEEQDIDVVRSFLVRQGKDAEIGLDEDATSSSEDGDDEELGAIVYGNYANLISKPPSDEDRVLKTIVIKTKDGGEDRFVLFMQSRFFPVFEARLRTVKEYPLLVDTKTGKEYLIEDNTGFLMDAERISFYHTSGTELGPRSQRLATEGNLFLTNSGRTLHYVWFEQNKKTGVVTWHVTLVADRIDEGTYRWYKAVSEKYLTGEKTKQGKYRSRPIYFIVDQGELRDAFWLPKKKKMLHVDMQDGSAYLFTRTLDNQGWQARGVDSSKDLNVKNYVKRTLTDNYLKSKSNEYAGFSFAPPPKKKNN